VSAGIYLHVPFCAHRCHYCDFNTYAGLDDQIPRYVAGLHAEIARVAAAGPPGVAPPGAEVDRDWPAFSSLFVGGGTPTLLDPDDLAGVVRRVRDELPLVPGAEVTVEANPETVTAEGMATLVDAGVDRVSMGAQSFAPHVLRALGRRHDVDRPLAAVADARAAGVRRISLDLISGTPGETPEDWAATLRAVLSAGTDHVSAYALTVEPGTEYAARVRRGDALAPDEDVQAEREEIARDVFAAAGLVRYEVSNWARPGQESVHNLTYWRGGDWLGIGAGAHGHWRGEAGRCAAETAGAPPSRSWALGDDVVDASARGWVGRRWWGLRAPARWADAALAGGATAGGEELIDAPTRRTERLMMGLRTVEGVARAEVEPVAEATVAALVRGGVLADDGDRLRVPEPALGLADGVVRRLLAA